jgi:type I restriction enzyme S subunit
MAGEVEEIRVIDSEIPDHWERATFRQLLKEGSLELVQDGNHGGAYPKPDEFEPTGIPIITGADLNAGAIDLCGCKFLKPASAGRLRIGFAKQGDVLLTHKGTMGKTAIVPPLSWPYIILNPQLTLYRVSQDGRLNRRFLKFFFDGKPFQAFLERISGISTISTLSLTVQKSLEIPLPPLAEQKAIAAVLGALDDKIELNRRMNATLEAMARALFQSWFVDFDPVRAKLDGRQPTNLDPATADLFPDSFEVSVLGHTPKGWEVRSLDKTAHYLNGLALQKYPPGDGPTLPVIKIAQLRKGDSVVADRCNTDLPPNYIVQDGDVLFSWSGSLEVELWCGGLGALNQHLFKVTSPEFPKWFYYLWTLYHLDEFRLIAADKATTMGHIQRGHLTAAGVLIPPRPLLDAMTRTMSPLIEQLIANRTQSRTLATLRDTLLPKLLSGELKVQ